MAAVAGVIAWQGGLLWYAGGPALVYAAYFIKLRVRGLHDKPSTVMGILTLVSLAMIGFAIS